MHQMISAFRIFSKLVWTFICNHKQSHNASTTISFIPLYSFSDKPKMQVEAVFQRNDLDQDGKLSKQVSSSNFTISLKLFPNQTFPSFMCRSFVIWWTTIKIQQLRTNQNNLMTEHSKKGLSKLSNSSIMCYVISKWWLLRLFIFVGGATSKCNNLGRNWLATYIWNCFSFIHCSLIALKYNLCEFPYF